jgi:ABC-2 type transport system ATP-binding protein
VFLDEPTAGLDPQARRDLHGEIARTKREGYTMLLSTHYIDEAEQLCDRVAIIDRGQIVAIGTPRELIARSKGTQSVSAITVRPLDGESLARLAGIHDLVCDGPRVRFTTLDLNRAIGELLALIEETRAGLVELHVRKASLEDVFIELTGAALRD